MSSWSWLTLSWLTLSLLSGRLYSEIFEEVPDRNRYIEFYKLNPNPLSLQMIEASFPFHKPLFTAFVPLP